MADGIRRKEAVGMQELVSQFIREMKISSGINRQRVTEAWNVASGASRYTLDVNFERGVAYCIISSSVVRNRLYFQKDFLLQRMNELLDEDGLFVRDGRGGPAVKALVLK